MAMSVSFLLRGRALSLWTLSCPPVPSPLPLHLSSVIVLWVSKSPCAGNLVLDVLCQVWSFSHHPLAPCYVLQRGHAFFPLLFEQALYCTVEEILIRSLCVFKTLKDLPNIYKNVRSHTEEVIKKAKHGPRSVVSGGCNSKFFTALTFDLTIRPCSHSFFLGFLFYRWDTTLHILVILPAMLIFFLSCFPHFWLIQAIIFFKLLPKMHRFPTISVSLQGTESKNCCFDGVLVLAIFYFIVTEVNSS